jgi:hypothetical protein
MSETSNPKTDYFEYLENVLGIKSIIEDSLAAHAPVAAQAKVTELLFCVENYKLYNDKELDLLQKMITAVKVDPSKIKICDLIEHDQYQKKVCVLFVDDLLKVSAKADLVVKAISPRILINKPELKKVAWAELQKVLQYFARSKTEI